MKRLQQALLLLMVATMVDTCVSAARSDPRRFALVAGETLPVSGKLDGVVAPAPAGGGLFSGNRITDPGLLAVLLQAVPSSSWIAIRFLERNGRLWRAALSAHPDAPPGDYPIHVLQPGEVPAPGNRYTVTIHPDADARDRAAASLTMRCLGVAPWWIGLMLVPAVAALLAASWRRTRSEERRLRRQGFGAIYKLARRKDHWELAAGLGADDGITEGEEIRLLTRDFQPLASIRAHRVRKDHLYARIDLSVPVTPHCYVRRHHPDTPADLADDR